MKLTVNLWSRKNGEIKRFLENYYGRDLKMDEDTGEWACTYGKPMEAVDMISAVIDNNDKYQIAVCIQMDEGQLHHITINNHNDIIKDIFNLFYNENVLELN
ncbi:MAG: hypothetical protein ABFD25_05390 [Clostridiaceae bacterium]